MKKYRNLLILIGLSPVMVECNQAPTGTETIKEAKPNIIVIYADDLGFGDLSSYGATVLQTPNIDRISNDGIRFTNGYATSATCTPSRYALLTGQYPWRNKRAEILRGNDPLIIDTTMQTMPSMLSEAGYKTAVIGKWHLGLGGEGLDWNREVSPGPRDVGFDYSYIMASTNDRVPTVYVENETVVGLDECDPIEVSYPTAVWPNQWDESENFDGEPTGFANPELLKLHPSHGHDMSIHNGISRIGFMRGGKSALWIDEDMADTILNRTKAFITEQKNGPFFLFYSLHQPHVPRTPHARFSGKSGLGPRGDAILEADWCVGQVLDHIKELRLEENTIVIFSSDNGPVLDDGYQDQAEELNGEHTPAGELRGGKYSLFDAGTHVPFMIKWPKKIKPRVSDALVCQVDLMSTLASINQLKTRGEDSEDFSSLFSEEAEGRESLILEAMGNLAVIKGNWVMIPPYDGPRIVNQWVKNETGLDQSFQLYDLGKDPGQEVSLANEYPEIVEELKLMISSSKKQ